MVEKESQTPVEGEVSEVKAPDVELTEEELQEKMNVLIAERTEAEQKENEERLVAELKEREVRLEEEEKVRADQEKKLKSLTTQVGNLKDEGVDISSLVDSVSNGAMAKVATYERRGASLSDQIAYWLEVSTGKPHDGDDILILDVRADRVQYRFKGTQNIASILRKPNEDLVDSPVHDHEYKVLVYGGQSACGCGKSNPES